MFMLLELQALSFIGWMVVIATICLLFIVSVTNINVAQLIAPLKNEPLHAAAFWLFFIT